MLDVTLDLTSLPAMPDAAEIRAQHPTVASDAQDISLASAASILANPLEV